MIFIQCELLLLSRCAAPKTRSRHWEADIYPVEEISILRLARLALALSRSQPLSRRIHRELH